MIICICENSKDRRLQYRKVCMSCIWYGMVWYGTCIAGWYHRNVVRCGLLQMGMHHLTYLF